MRESSTVVRPRRLRRRAAAGAVAAAIVVGAVWVWSASWVSNTSARVLCIYVDVAGTDVLTAAVAPGDSPWLGWGTVPSRSLLAPVTCPQALL